MEQQYISLSPKKTFNKMLNSYHSFGQERCAKKLHQNYTKKLYQKDKSSESKVKVRQASNHYKRVLEAAKLAYANKTRVHYFPETWLS